MSQQEQNAFAALKPLGSPIDDPNACRLRAHRLSMILKNSAALNKYTAKKKDIIAEAVALYACEKETYEAYGDRNCVLLIPEVFANLNQVGLYRSVYGELCTYDNAFDNSDFISHIEACMQGRFFNHDTKRPFNLQVSSTFHKKSFRKKNTGEFWYSSNMDASGCHNLMRPKGLPLNYRLRPREPNWIQDTRNSSSNRRPGIVDIEPGANTARDSRRRISAGQR